MYTDQFESNMDLLPALESLNKVYTSVCEGGCVEEDDPRVG